MANTIGSRSFAALAAYSVMSVSMAAVVRPDWPFEANADRFDANVAYVAHTSHGGVFVTREGRLVYALGTGSMGEHATSSRHLSPAGAERTSTHISDFHGNDPSRWRTDVATFHAVDIGEPWPGIDLQLIAHDRNVEKIYTLQPGADASRIRMSVDGARLRIDATGSLVAGDVSFTHPIAYQTIDGVRRDVGVRYVLRGSHAYSFAIGAHDPHHAVVIDPLIQTTYSGGSGADEIHAMAIDPFDGAVVVTGSTNSNDFPGVAGGYQTSRPSIFGSVFVARYNPDLTALIQATYIAGTHTDYPRAVAIHPVTGDIYVAGYTLSTDFPGTTGGAQSAHAGTAGSYDAFVAQLSSDLKTLRQSTYLGGSNDEDAFALAIAPTGGGVYVSGTTYSTDFPVQGGEQNARNGVAPDAFLTLFSADLSSIVASTYYGGTEGENGYNLAIDPSNGDVILLGRTQSTDLPGRAGGVQSALPGAQNGFLARFNATLSTLQQATYLGGSGVEEEMDGIVVEPTTHDIFVVGDTTSKDFPGTAGGYQSTAGASSTAVVVSRLASNLQSIVQSTYIGVDNSNSGRAIALDPASGDIFVTGQTDSRQFPGVAGGAQYILSGTSDIFTLRMSGDLKTLRQSTYLGGGNDEQSFAIAIPSNGEVYVAGLTYSSNFPGTLGGAQPNTGSPGSGDGFIARYKRDLSELFESGFEVP